MQEIKYYELVCDKYKGVKNLDVYDKIALMGYDGWDPEYKEYVEMDEEQLNHIFLENYDGNFRGMIQGYGLTLLEEKVEDYYLYGAKFYRKRYKIKGKKEHIEDALKLWFIVEHNEVDLEALWLADKK